jgi:DNA polymerase
VTAEEKTTIASFLDTAGDYLRDGYRRNRGGYTFADTGNSAEPMVRAAGENPQAELDTLGEEIRSCTGCSLCRGRTKAVPGEGIRVRPLVLVVGEGPGADEDTSGRPFVGKAGQLLDKMLASIGLSRETNCFIANVVKCRPPDNREPQPDETAACIPFLERQIALLEPRIILCLGRTATQTLLQTTEPIGRLRGRFTEYRLQTDAGRIPLLPTYHPSALLRDEALKRPAWEDLKTLKARISAQTGEAHP